MVEASHGAWRGRRARAPDAAAVPRRTVLIVWMAAALIFAGAAPLTLEWVDEGHLAYAMWRVSQGATPYQEFQHIYGPSTFFFNAAGLWLFGHDLLVIRAGLVLCKASIVTGIYLGARQLAPSHAALVAAVLATAIYSAPIWIFNTPYANHYAVGLSLIGLIAFLRFQRRLILAAALAGLCFGLAATFKQTTGLFALFALLLVVLEVDGGAARVVAPHLARMVRIAIVLSATAVSLGFLLSGNAVGNAVIIGGPWAALCTWTAWRQIRLPEADVAWHAPAAALVAGAAFAVPLGLYGGWYAYLGRVPELVYNTLDGLPQLTRWWVPFPVSDRHGLLATAVLAALLSASRIVDERASSAWLRALRWGGVCLGGVAFVAAWRDPVGTQGGANAIVFGALPSATLAVVWAAMFSRISGWGLPPQPDQRLAFSLLTGFAAVSALGLHPAADIWHVLAVVPTVLPIGTAMAVRITARPAGGGVATTAVVLCLMVAGVVGVVVEKHLALLPVWRATGGRLAHASTILDSRPEAGAAAAVVEYLAAHGGGEPLFVVSGEQMFYFLTARPSVFEHEEFLLYLFRINAIEPAAARASLSDTAFVDRLVTRRPLLVSRTNDPSADRLREILPATWTAIAAGYEVVFSAGPYRVMAWREQAAT